MHRHKMKGFTLLEMLLVVAIIAILLAIGIPAYTSSLAQAKKTVCLSNRRTLLSAVNMEYLLGSYSSLEEGFHEQYEEKGETTYVCPEGGVFSWVKDSEEKGHILCSYHDKGAGGGEAGGGEAGGGEAGGGEAGGGETGDGETGGNKLPGTEISLSDNHWPTDRDFQYEWSNVAVSAGGIFQYSDGNYYVVTRDITITKSQAKSGPGGDANGWYATQKISGKVVSYEGNEQKSDLQRGDICKVGDAYYVFKDGGSYGYSPAVSPNQWYKLP